MKLVLFSSLLCVGILISIISVEGTSVMNCDECDKELCNPPGDCQCGSYLDECKCCERCYKCNGEECSRIANERCHEGECKPKDGLNPIEAMNQPGVCQ